MKNSDQPMGYDIKKVFNLQAAGKFYDTFACDFRIR